MGKLFAAIAGLGVFIGWMRLVGNPHVVETVMGAVFGFIVFLWVFFKLR